MSEPQDKEYVKMRTPLSNTAYKLKTQKSLRVAYMGGSVTSGTGGTGDGWRGIVNSYLTTHYADADIQKINVYMGGNGSRLGLHMLERFVLNENPDLIFIEYAVNIRMKSGNRLAIVLFLVVGEML